MKYCNVTSTLKRSFLNIKESIVRDPVFWGCTAAGLFLLLFSSELFALTDEQAMAELKKVKQETDKATKTICYLIGCGSGVGGALHFASKQSIPVGIIATVVTVAAFKFPSMISGSLII